MDIQNLGNSIKKHAYGGLVKRQTKNPSSGRTLCSLFSEFWS